jgi:hypothetical protein
MLHLRLVTGSLVILESSLIEPFASSVLVAIPSLGISSAADGFSGDSAMSYRTPTEADGTEYLKAVHRAVSAPR